jgi:uncharacterized damage-inducible protein DinB
MVALYRDLFDHMEWADARIWEAVLKTEHAGDDEAIRAILVHIHSAQRAFLDAWAGNAPAFRTPADFPDVASVYEYATGYYPAAREAVETLSDSRASEVLVLPWVSLVEERIGRAAAPTTVGETIMQVISHTTHHRAQISVRLRLLLGGEPPVVDYIAWIWFGRPQPQWPAAPVR